MVPETSTSLNQMTWLIAKEDFINVSDHVTFTSYKVSVICLSFM